MIGNLIDQRYEIQSELGRGGMGIVYRAQDRLLEREVAIKVMTAQALGSAGKAFLLAEARAVARLDHPNITAVYDAGEVDGMPFIVMQLVGGMPLSESRLQTQEEILEVARQICAALEHAHGQGVVHRDIKPENVMVTRGDGVRVKLMDFGLARPIATRLTSDGGLVGTVYYLAPELALGQDFDGRADLYALGVMLYELTTGVLPFPQGDPLAVISQHLHAPVIPPRAKNPELPPLLDQLILRLMSKRPEDRPASAADVLEALQRTDLLDPEARVERELRVIDRIARGRFVGRERALAEARELWSTAAAGSGQTLLISGEPGIGKTRLMRELATHVEVTGGRTMVGTCYAEGGAPYAPFAQIVRRTLSDSPQLGQSLPNFVLADLLTLAPELKPYYTNVHANPPLEPQAEQHRLFENMVAFCSMLSDQTSIMLALDDAHWADSGSLSMLRHLARRTRRKPVLLMATYREVELDEARPFHEVMLDLNRERLATRLKLSRLTKEETEALLAAILEEDIAPEFLDGIYRETEGNPFFIEEVCKALVEEGKLYFQDGRWHQPSMDELEIPQSVRVAIQSRVAIMPEPFQETLRLAAILGREFDFDTLAEASELDEDNLIEAIEAAEHAQLIEEVSGRGGKVAFSFLHALIPATLEESVHTLRRRRLHRQAAVAIESLRPGDLEVLAYHYSEAGDEPKALNYFTRAGERALAAYANQEAENHFRAALYLSQIEADRANLLSQLSSALANQSRFREALETWRSAITLYQSLGDTEHLAWCYARSARSAWEDGDFLHSLELAEEGMRALDAAPDSPGLADLLHETGRAYFFNGVPDKAAALTRRALELAERTGAVKIQAEALNTYGVLDDVPAEEAIDSLERAVELAKAHDLPESESRARNNLSALIGIYQGKVQIAREHLLAAAKSAHNIGQASQELFYRSFEVWWAMSQGDLAYAKKELVRLQELYEKASRPVTSGVFLMRTTADLARAEGEFSTAAELYQESLVLARKGSLLQDILYGGCALAEMLVSLGKLDQAHEILLECVGISDRIGGQDYPRMIIAIVHARRGELEAARRWLAEAEEEWNKNPAVYMSAWLAYARAQVSLAEKQWEEAWAHFAQCSNQWEGMGLRLERALTLLAWAEAHLSRDEPQDNQRGRQLLQEALAEFEAMGSAGYIAKIQAQLQDLEQRSG